MAGWLLILSLGTAPAHAGRVTIPGPFGSGRFGASVTFLPNGNFVVTDPKYDAPGQGADVGAAFLYHGTTLSLLATITGSAPNDHVGSGGVVVVKDSNFLVRSPYWNQHRGAVTWCEGTGGTSGVVSPANSLAGGAPFDSVGVSEETATGFETGIVVTDSGDYLVCSEGWNSAAGAVTWGSGATGVRGVVSAGNSLTGGLESRIHLLRNGNYLVLSPQWPGGGAVTWGGGTGGVKGEISAALSLVGGVATDGVGDRGVVELTNGNYLVLTAKQGAVTWGNGAVGVRGVASETNSLRFGPGSGALGVIPLTDGDYLVGSSAWNNRRGAVTWSDGATGVAGMVSAANSLVGSVENDEVGSGGFRELANGNYVVQSWNWNGARGAVTWGSGSAGVKGELSIGNSLIGTAVNEKLGLEPLGLLRNGDYVMSSPNWNNSRGAATRGDGATGVKGEVSAANSLVGGAANDRIQAFPVPLTDPGSYLVGSPLWDNGAIVDTGIVAAVQGSSPESKGVITAAHGLIGGFANDQIGSRGVHGVGSGNFVVNGSNWNGDRGAVTWSSGSSPVKGAVSQANSLIGSTAGDFVGGGVIITVLQSGNYVISSPFWNGARGAATFGPGDAALTGVVSETNSLVGSSAGDQVGKDIVRSDNGNYLVRSPSWKNGNRMNAGALTWGRGASGVKGVLSGDNSLVGDFAEDRLGDAYLYDLANGGYVVVNPKWNASRGAVIWSGAEGARGVMSASNSLVGDTPGSPIADGNLITLSNGNYLVGTHSVNGETFQRAAALTWGSGTAGATGLINPANSLICSVHDESSSAVFALNDGNYVAYHPDWNAGAGALSFGQGEGGVTGTISAGNSVLGIAVEDSHFLMDWDYAAGKKLLIVGNPTANQVVLWDSTPEITDGDPDILPNWRALHFGDATEETGDLDDFDSDGVTNLVEFALDTSPADNRSGSAPLVYTGEGGGISATGQPFVRGPGVPGGPAGMSAVFLHRKNAAAAGVACVPQFSADLATWTDSDVEPAVVAEDANNRILSVPCPAGGKAWFFRVKVTITP